MQVNADAEVSEESLFEAFQEIQLATYRLLSTMDSNLFLLEDSVREVRTARQIAAESNRAARRRALREGDPVLMAGAK